MAVIGRMATILETTFHGDKTAFSHGVHDSSLADDNGAALR
jgi:hypothetical protein